MLKEMNKIRANFLNEAGVLVNFRLYEIIVLIVISIIFAIAHYAENKGTYVVGFVVLFIFVAFDIMTRCDAREVYCDSYSHLRLSIGMKTVDFHVFKGDDGNKKNEIMEIEESYEKAGIFKKSISNPTLASGDRLEVRKYFINGEDGFVAFFNFNNCDCLMLSDSKFDKEKDDAYSATDFNYIFGSKDVPSFFETSFEVKPFMGFVKPKNIGEIFSVNLVKD